MLNDWSLKTETESEWVSISDLMSVLMMIFLFIAISYMQTVEQDKEFVEKVAVAYRDTRNDLYTELAAEFKDDLPKWKAVIEAETLTIRFEEPDVLFGVGSSYLSGKFEHILDDFFPRYVKIISAAKYQDSIEEIRIEGHTSSEWNGEARGMEAYFNNMALSQNRTRSVLKYCLNLVHEPKTLVWSREHITANGLSSSRLIRNNVGIEDKRKSRRVEFRTKTNAEKKVFEIYERLKRT